jgi:uncharacterized protein YdeI (YjbR/CyaY-like superfamily)
MISEIEDYFAKGCGRCARFDTPECSTRRWSTGLAGLREICRAAGLGETVKWGHPCYVHAGRNIALIGAFRDDFRLKFMNAALMRDPEGILEREGPNTHHPGLIRFGLNARPTELADTITAYLKEAMGYAEAGIVPPRELPRDEMPEELVSALDDDPELAEAFAALTPGRQRSYLLNLNSARTSATRHARIARFRDQIVAGKGANER